jgi:hypothetical protein
VERILGAPSSYEIGGTTRWPVIADLDGDSNPDIAVAVLSSNSIVILRGDGAGHFTVVPSTGTTNISSPFFLSAADLNGDARPIWSLAHLA